MICLSLAYCSSGCVNGVCSGPDTCVCDVRWRGNDCNSSMLHYTPFFPDDNIHSGLVVKLIHSDHSTLKF